MFDRFEEDAKHALDLARRHAVEHRHEFLAPEHMLLGLLDLPNCSACELLQEMNVSLGGLRAEILQRMRPHGTPSPSGQLPLAPRSKQAFELMLEEASVLGHGWLGTVHLLVALARVEGVAHDALKAAGLEVGTLRERIRAAPEPALNHAVARRAVALPLAEQVAALSVAACVLDLRQEADVAGAVRDVIERLRSLQS